MRTLNTNAPTITPRPAAGASAPRPAPGTPRSNYSLRKGLGAWELTFEGRNAILKTELGLEYAAYLLRRRQAGPIHALDLATRVAAANGMTSGITEVSGLASGRATALDRNATVQERSLGLDTAETMRQVLRRQRELEALLEDEDTIEPVSVEARRELIELYRYEEKNTARVRTNAQRCVRAVRMAIKRFHARLAGAVDADGRPNAVLRAFGEHIEDYLLVPSSRCTGRGRLAAKAGLAGSFTYEPPAGVTWEG